MPLNTDKSSNVTDAMNTRITARGFLDTPVPEDILSQILTTALRSPPLAGTYSLGKSM